MKYFSLLALIIVINIGITTSANVAKPERRNSYAIIYQLFELMRQVIRNGCEEKGVPVMDPYFSDFTVNLSKGLFSLNANITQSKITGLGDFYMAKSNFNKTEISIDTKLIFPHLQFYSDFYEMEGNIGTAIPLEGSGIFNIKVRYLTILGKIYLKQSENGKSILIDRVENPRFYIEKIVSAIQLDDNFDDIFNAMIGDLLAGYLNRFNGYFTYLFTQPAIDLLNPMLDKFDTWQILDIIL